MPPSQETATLRDFDSAYIWCRSSMAEAVDVIPSSMSASSRKRPPAIKLGSDASCHASCQKRPRATLKLTRNAIEMVSSGMQQRAGYWLTRCCDKLRIVR